MDKKEKRIDRVQNILIVLLAVSALTLLTRTPLFGDFSDRAPLQPLTELFRSDSASPDRAQTTLSAFSTPVRLLCTNDYARFGQDAVTVLDTDFDRVSSLLGDAFASAASPSDVGEDAFLSALQRPGLYVDFTAELPLSILRNTLGAAPELPDELLIRRLLLVPDGSTTELYLLGGSGSCTRCGTELKSVELLEFLNEQNGNGAYLSAQLAEEYNRLSPYALILPEQTQRSALSASNPLADADYTELLRAAEFNPHTENRYTESSGATVIREGDSSLRIDTDGTVTYQGPAAEDGSLYLVDSQSGSPSAVEAVAAVQKLAVTLIGSSSGAAALYLSEVRDTPAGYTITLDYVVSGTPLCFSDASHAFSAQISGRSITAFSLHCRCYTQTDEQTLLLPLPQAFAIAEDEYEGTEPLVCYIDTGTGSVMPGWIAA